MELKEKSGWIRFQSGFNLDVQDYQVWMWSLERRNRLNRSQVMMWFCYYFSPNFPSKPQKKNKTGTFKFSEHGHFPWAVVDGCTAAERTTRLVLHVLAFVLRIILHIPADDFKLSIRCQTEFLPSRQPFCFWSFLWKSTCSEIIHHSQC